MQNLEAANKFENFFGVGFWLKLKLLSLLLCLQYKINKCIYMVLYVQYIIKFSQHPKWVLLGALSYRETLLYNSIQNNERKIFNPLTFSLLLYLKHQLEWYLKLVQDLCILHIDHSAITLYEQQYCAKLHMLLTVFHNVAIELVIQLFGSGGKYVCGRTR